MDNEASRWLSAHQVAGLLGVKPATVYAYVSRGILHRHKGSGFSRAEVERLAARTNRSGRAGTLDVVVDSELTLLDPEGGLYFRGHDALLLAQTSSFEAVSELLWTPGFLPSPRGLRPHVPPKSALPYGKKLRWSPPESDVLDIVRGMAVSLPESARLTDRMRVIVAAMAGLDRVRDVQRTPDVIRAARTCIAAVVDGLPERSAGNQVGKGTRIADRLWARLSRRSPGRGEVKTLNAALVLLADHDLAASTLAARVAASAWADPHLVLLTGLSAASGALHGASATEAESILRAPDSVELLTERAHRGERLPGFGHKVYVGLDPRADLLLQLVARAGRKSPIDEKVTRLVETAERNGWPPANVDLALAYFCVKADLAPGAGEAIFLLGRMAGIIAHAIEEYPHRLRFRPRALYTGRPPV